VGTKVVSTFVRHGVFKIIHKKNVTPYSLVILVQEIIRRHIPHQNHYVTGLVLEDPPNFQHPI